jgi:hypothetical protein
MDVKEQQDQHPADVAAQAVWAASESRFQTPEELDAQLTPPDDNGGYRRHGVGPATVVMALAQAGFRGPINTEWPQGPGGAGHRPWSTADGG